MIIVASTATALLNLAAPFLIKAATDVIVDAINGLRDVDDAVTVVIFIALALFAAELTYTVVHNIGGWFGDVMALKMRQLLSDRYFAKLLSLPQTYFDKQVTGTADKGEDAIIEQEQRLRAMSAADIEQQMPAFKACFDWIRGL